MDPVTISWIVAAITGSIVAKVLGLIMKGRDPGMVAGPVLGVVGALIAWRGLVFAGILEADQVIPAGISAALGGAVAYLIAAFLKGRKA